MLRGIAERILNKFLVSRPCSASFSSVFVSISLRSSSCLACNALTASRVARNSSPTPARKTLRLIILRRNQPVTLLIQTIMQICQHSAMLKFQYLG